MWNFKGSLWNSTQISYPYVERCIVCWQVKIYKLPNLQARKCFWNTPMTPNTANTLSTFTLVVALKTKILLQVTIIQLRESPSCSSLLAIILRMRHGPMRSGAMLQSSLKIHSTPWQSWIYELFSIAHPHRQTLSCLLWVFWSKWTSNNRHAIDKCYLGFFYWENSPTNMSLLHG